MKKFLFILILFCGALKAQIPDSCYSASVFIKDGIVISQDGKVVLVKVYNRAYQNLANYWADSVLSNYHHLNTAIGTSEWNTIYSYLYDKFRDINGYYWLTYGSGGLNKWDGKWFFYLKTSGNIVSRTNTMSQGNLRWDIDGTIYDQRALPAYTKGANDGNVICSSNYFSYVNVWAFNTNNFENTFPNLQTPNCTQFTVAANYVSFVPNLNIPNSTTFSISGNPINSNIIDYTHLNSVIVFNISSCGITGSIPNYNLPACTQFQAQSNSMTGTFNVTLSTNYTQCLFYTNDFTAITFYPLTKTTSYNGSGNNLNQTAMDNFLCNWYNQLSDGSHDPIANITCTMNGTGMASPSATGAACETNIVNFYSSKGRTATILVN